MIEILNSIPKEDELMEVITELMNSLCDVIQGEYAEKGYLEKLSLRCEEIFKESTDFLKSISNIIDSKLLE